MGCITDLLPIRVASELAGDPPLFVAADDVRLTVLDPFNLSGARAAADGIAALLRSKPRARPEALRLLATLAGVSGRAEFVDALDAAHAAFVERRFPQPEFVLLCLHLYVRGVILFPRNFVRGGETPRPLQPSSPRCRTGSGVTHAARRTTTSTWSPAGPSAPW